MLGFVLESVFVGAVEKQVLVVGVISGRSLVCFGRQKCFFGGSESPRGVVSVCWFVGHSLP